MKNLVFLYAGEFSPHAFDKIFDGKSAFDRCVEWSVRVPDSLATVIACCPENRKFAEENLRAFSEKKIVLIEKEFRTNQIFFQELSEKLAEFHADNAVISFADRPFLDSALTEKILHDHEKFISEYTFADGYPKGFAPEEINAGTVNILLSLMTSGENEKCRNLAQKKFSTESIFEILKTDINSFEIESVLAPEDYRLLRLDFSCAQKRNALACKKLFEISAEKNIPLNADSLSELAENSSCVQRTLPAFYNVQISANVNADAFYSPYRKIFFEKFGVNPRKNENEIFSDMDEKKFSALVKKISDFSEDAVVGLSAWGEPLLHEKFLSFAEEVLKRKKLSLLIETDGTLLTEELAEKIRRIADSYQDEKNSAEKNPRIFWIVFLDATTKENYEKIFDGGNFDAAFSSVGILQKFFPGAVYPQFTRMNENEDDLENFFRFWHAKNSPSGGNVLIQKYNDFCKFLPDRKSADLSPLERNSCWHLKRDMTILCDGSVPVCRQFFFDSAGNAFDENLEDIWEKISVRFEADFKKDYCEKCGNCDEFYTFNF
jgi:spiro-SPASM protein